MKNDGDKTPNDLDDEMMIIFYQKGRNRKKILRNVGNRDTRQR